MTTALQNRKFLVDMKEEELLSVFNEYRNEFRSSFSPDKISEADILVTMAGQFVKPEDKNLGATGRGLELSQGRGGADRLATKGDKEKTS